MDSRASAARARHPRWLPLSGLAFVGCFAVAVVLYGDGAGSDPSGIAAYYANEANALRQIGGFAVLLAGCVFLSIYVVVAARELAGRELLATIAVTGGSAAALLLAVGNALWAASAFTVEIENGYRIGAGAHLLIEDAGFVVVVTAMAFAIPFVVATTLAASRSRRLPRWFAPLGAVAALGLATAYWYWPIAAFLLWTACGSILMSKAGPSAVEGGAATAEALAAG